MKCFIKRLTNTVTWFDFGITRYYIVVYNVLKRLWSKQLLENDLFPRIEMPFYQAGKKDTHNTCNGNYNETWIKCMEEHRFLMVFKWETTNGGTKAINRGNSAEITKYTISIRTFFKEFVKDSYKKCGDIWKSAINLIF